MAARRRRLTLIAVALVTGAVVLRGWVRRGRPERQHRPRAVGPDGIIAGAAPIVLDGGKEGVLILHGFGDTPQSVGIVAQALHAAGFTVYAPLLPGHGRTLGSFTASRGAEWEECVRGAFAALAGRCERTAIVGVSMGGALACTVAAAPGSHRPPAALVLITPYLHRSLFARLLTGAWPLWSLVHPWIPANLERSIREPGARARSLGYGMATPRLLRELRGVVERGMRASAQATMPALAIFSAHDYRIPETAARAAFARLAACEKELRWVERSGHVITVDYDAADVAAWTRAWLERWLRQVPRGVTGERP